MTHPRYQGWNIEHNENGWFSGDLGYFDTREDLEDEIRAYNCCPRSDENIYGLASVQQSIEEDRR